MKEIAKSKTASKLITYEGDDLKKIVLSTLQKASALVGSTLGPNGKIVLIERQENLGPYTSKDGITVFNSMAFSDSTAQAVLEAARDSSSKTNSEAGDGPLPKWTKILTPKGYVELGDLKPGMTICGTNGTFQQVLGVYQKGEKEIYEIEIENKGVIECCADHLWTVTDCNGNTQTLTTSKLMSDYVSKKDGYTKYKYYTPRTHVDFYENKAEMPIDPYTFGVLLGDGSLRDSGSIELSLGFSKKHILDKLVMPEGINVSVQEVESKKYYRVKFSGTDYTGKSMRDHVRSLGLGNASSGNKFIPRSYLYSSLESRRALLQGIMDTDGHINVRDRFEISTISDELSANIIELARSLGMTIGHTLKTRTKESGCYSDTPVHRIYELKGYKYGDKITRITPTGRFTEMQCIKVSNPDSLYVIDNYIVTHNTTTATILAESLIKLGFEYLEKNPHLSTQKIVRELEQTFENVILPFIAEHSVKVKNDTADDLLRKVSLISTNNDAAMTDAVLECFGQVGYNGNITIAETAGSSGFDVEKIEGFPIARGFEDTCGRFLEEFINDKGNYKTVLDKPQFVLYNGKINSMSTLLPAIDRIGNAYEQAIRDGVKFSPNVVIVAHHFSDDVLAQLAFNFKDPSSINYFPLKTVMTQQANSPYHFLVDMAAFTGATVYDPLTKPLESFDLSGLGTGTMDTFECYRYKSLVLGNPDEFMVITRSEELEKQAQQAESILDAEILRERLAILTGGIARLKVKGSSEAELKEKRHRVEDAVAAIKGALKYGVLPGCAKTLMALSDHIHLNVQSDAVKTILCEAFTAPFRRILTNGGHNQQEISDVALNIMYDISEVTEVVTVPPSTLKQKVLQKVFKSPPQQETRVRKVAKPKEFWHTYDALHDKYGHGIEIGVVDSASAVIMAIKNSLSVAKMLMGLSGIVVFQRDHELDRSTAKNFHSQEAAIQEAIQRAEHDKFEPPF